jgi:hypothetical protein
MTQQPSNQPTQAHLNPGLSEREIAEILTSSGMVNGMVTNGVKLAHAIADIIVKNNERLLQAILTGHYRQPPLEDVATKHHQTAAPTEMWEAGQRPQSGMPAPDTTTHQPH